jgi:phenylpropionate dioxygenase-like ring-hydroxylating dioxygenase large terminal subunit
VLGGAQDDLSSFALDTYTHIESRTNEWNFNWKLFFDTFSESYHIRTLHSKTLAPTFNSDCVVFEPFGRNLLSVGLRANVHEELAKPEDEWSLLPYGTIQYFLVPNGMVVYQVDHIETWIVEPLAVNRTRTTASVYSPTPPATEKSRNYFVKNLELLLHVTGVEDFALMQQVQQSLDAGALPEFVYGANEPPLIHFHEQVNRVLAGTAK